MGRLISSQAPVTDLKQACADIQIIMGTLETYMVHLSQEDKMARSMAEGREGIVRLISKIATAHPDSLGKKDNSEELEACLAYDAELESVRQMALSMLETITDTQLANSIDAMTLADRYAGSMQNDRDNNATLNAALGELDGWNKRFGAKPHKDSPEEPEK